MYIFVGILSLDRKFNFSCIVVIKADRAVWVDEYLSVPEKLICLCRRNISICAGKMYLSVPAKCICVEEKCICLCWQNVFVCVCEMYCCFAYVITGCIYALPLSAHKDHILQLHTNTTNTFTNAFLQNKNLRYLVWFFTCPIAL